MKVYEINEVYFLVDKQKDVQTVIAFTADQPMPHIYPLGASLLTEEFLAKATLCIDESFFFGVPSLSKRLCLLLLWCRGADPIASPFLANRASNPKATI